MTDIPFHTMTSSQSRAKVGSADSLSNQLFMISSLYDSCSSSPETHLDDMCNTEPVFKTPLLTGEITESQQEYFTSMLPIIWSNYSDYTSLLLSPTTLLEYIMRTTEPVEETSILINEAIVAPSGYKFTSEYQSAPAANLDLDQEHKDPVMHSHYLVDSHHYSPVIHPSSLVTQQLMIGLNFEHLKEQLHN